MNGTMNVTSAKYYKAKNVDGTNKSENFGVTAMIDGVEYSVPIDNDNRFYAAVQEWVAAGNTIADAD